MQKIINSQQAPAPIGPYNQAVKAGPYLFCSGQIALNPENGELVNSSVKAEANQVMKNLQAVLTEADFDWDNVVKTTIYLRNMHDFEAVNKIYGSYFKPEFAPARETVAVFGLPKNVNVEISIIAYKSLFG